MPTLVIERFAPPAGTRRDARTRAYCGERAADELVGRTVWCSPDLLQPLARLLGQRAAVRTYADALVGPDDIVLLDEAPLAPEIRERGAHAVVPVRTRPAAAPPASLGGGRAPPLPRTGPDGASGGPSAPTAP